MSLVSTPKKSPRLPALKVFNKDYRKSQPVGTKQMEPLTNRLQFHFASLASNTKTEQIYPAAAYTYQKCLGFQCNKMGTCYWKSATELVMLDAPRTASQKIGLQNHTESIANLDVNKNEFSINY